MPLPTSNTAWGGTKTEPTTKRATGWVPGDEPPAEWWNWWMSSMSDWQIWLEAERLRMDGIDINARKRVTSKHLGNFVPANEGTTVATPPFNTAQSVTAVGAMTSGVKAFLAGSSTGVVKKSADGHFWSAASADIFGTAGGVSAIATNNLFWVVVGLAGKARYADATVINLSFSTATTLETIFGADNILDVQWANNQFVAVGASGKIAYSATGSGTWTQATSNFAGLQINRVKWVGGIWGWVAMGVGANIVTSPDGVTWTARAVGSLTGTGLIRDVCVHAGTTLVAVGGTNSTVSGNAYIATATALGALTQRLSVAGGSFLTVASNDTVCVTGGIAGLTYSATAPGGTWTVRPFPPSSVPYISFATSHLMVYDGVFLAFGSNYTVGVSFDGTTWYLGMSDCNVAGSSGVVTNCSFGQGVAFNGNVIIMAGSAGRISHSLMEVLL